MQSLPMPRPRRLPVMWGAGRAVFETAVHWLEALHPFAGGPYADLEAGGDGVQGLVLRPYPLHHFRSTAGR